MAGRLVMDPELTSPEVLAFNGRVVFIDEMALNQLNGQAGLSDATSTNHHQFIFS